MKGLRWLMMIVVLLVPAVFLLHVGQPGQPRTLHVLAAASLRDAFTEIGHAFESRYPGVRVDFAFAGSQTLRLQIEQGAPADVFASADRQHMDPLLRAGLIGAERPLAHNNLVVIIPAKGTKVRALKDLAKPALRIVLAGPDVPAGRYAETVLARMDRSGRYGAGYAAKVGNNVVSREQDVRGVLTKVALDEADAGIVYATDPRAERDRVRVLPIPVRMNVTAEYPIAAIQRSASPKTAARFVAFVTGPEGQAILKRYGFLP